MLAQKHIAQHANGRFLQYRHGWKDIDKKGKNYLLLFLPCVSNRSF